MNLGLGNIASYQKASFSGSARLDYIAKKGYGLLTKMRPAVLEKNNSLELIQLQRNIGKIANASDYMSLSKGRLVNVLS